MNLDPLRREVTDEKAERIFEAMNLLRKFDSEMPAQLLCSLFYVASHSHCHKQALEEDLGLSTASGSRNTDWLSDEHRLEKPGLGLITKRKDDSNKRRSELALTQKGWVLMDQLKSILFDS